MSTELSLIEMRLTELRREADRERLALRVLRARAARRRDEAAASAEASAGQGVPGRRWVPRRRANA